MKHPLATALRSVPIVDEPSAAAETGTYPRWVIPLFLLFALYLVLPLFDIPLLGLSVSAPMFFLVALPVILRPASRWGGAYRGWIGVAVLIWTGIAVSAVVNGLSSGGTQIDRDGIQALVRYAYWLLVFVVTVYFVSSEQGLARRLAGVLALGVGVLAALRLGEAAFGGAIGASTRLRLLSQNAYGIQFSTFFPIAVGWYFFRPKRRLPAVVVLAVLAAALMNGSRGSWLSIAVSTAVLFLLHLQTQRRRLSGIVGVAFLAVAFSLVAMLAPPQVQSAIQARFSTFGQLDDDKSYAIRQLMDQKGLLLFQANPLTGIGVSRWTKESIPLAIPRVLHYAGQEHFDMKSSHNSYISFLAENGLVGAVPLGILLLVLVLGGYRAATRLAATGEVWALGVYAGFVGMSIHLWALSGLTGTVTWFVYGLVGALVVLADKATPARRLDR